MQQIIRLYHDDLLPLWALRVGSMSSAELIRQRRVAQEHWLRRCRCDQGHKSRVAELTEIWNVLNVARFCFRAGAKRHKTYGNRDTLKKRASAAIARLSELYRQ